jgi:hypothetical protein
MTTCDPGTTPAGPQPGPTQPASEPGARAPQQEVPGSTPPQPGVSAGSGRHDGRTEEVAAHRAADRRRGIVGLGSLVGFADPEVGDCVQMAGDTDTDVDVVDCGSAEAEYRIVGIEGDERTYPAFLADPGTCADFASTEVALWIGELETEPGTVLCAEPDGGS